MRDPQIKFMDDSFDWKSKHAYLIIFHISIPVFHLYKKNHARIFSYSGSSFPISSMT
jgi:hypothetical protein